VIAPLYGKHLSDGQSISNGCLDVILPQALQHPYFFHILIAISRTIRMTGIGQVASDDEGIMFHRGEALHRLKYALADPSDDLLPLAVLHMVSLDVRSPACCNTCPFCLHGYSGVLGSRALCRSMRKAFKGF
jgi:hypothetical protein